MQDSASARAGSARSAVRTTATRATQRPTPSTSCSRPPAATPWRWSARTASKRMVLGDVDGVRFVDPDPRAQGHGVHRVAPNMSHLNMERFWWALAGWPRVTPCSCATRVAMSSSLFDRAWPAQGGLFSRRSPRPPPGAEGGRDQGEGEGRLSMGAVVAVGRLRGVEVASQSTAR